MATHRRNPRPGKKPTRKKPTAKRPTAKKPTAKKPTAKKPMAKKPMAKKPAAKKPMAKKPMAKKPAAKKPSRKPVRRGRSPAVRVTAEPGGARLDDGKVRLNRYLASSGVCSRRAADEWIEAGRVEVNGAVVTELGTRIDPDADEVRVDEERVEKEKRVYVLFNKPKNVVCTNARNEVRRRVIDFLGDVRGRIYTAGRLDADSEGLVLLTNDGELAHRITHPRYGVPKTYAVLVRGRVTDEDVRKARQGIWLAEGRTRGASVRVERRSRDRSYMKMTIREGRNREIRRVFARLGYPVISLKRVRIAGLNLHGLRAGSHRFLRAHEVAELLKMAEGEG